MVWFSEDFIFVYRSYLFTVYNELQCIRINVARSLALSLVAVVALCVAARATKYLQIRSGFTKLFIA